MTTTDPTDNCATTDNPTTDESIAADPRVKAFDQWASTEPALRELVTDPQNRLILRRVFLSGAITQEAIDAITIEAVAAQRDFLDAVCARSLDPGTQNWRSGFEDGCPPALIWESESGGVGVEGDEAHQAAELHLFEVRVEVHLEERLCWVVADSEATAKALAVQTVPTTVTAQLCDDALRSGGAILGPDDPYAGKSLVDAAAEQVVTGKPGYLGSSRW
jgi:hypothetical protein